MLTPPFCAILQLPTSGGDLAALLSPTVGLWHDRPALKTSIRPGQSIGTLEQLGIRRPLIAPDEADGVLAGPEDLRCIVPVEYGQILFHLKLGASATAPSSLPRHSGSEGEHALLFRAPLSGRFYDRPSPDAAPFVQNGAHIRQGQSIGLMEVMKTFHRIAYAGAFPAEAMVRRMLVGNGDDVAAGDPILELAPLSAPTDPRSREDASGAD